MSDHAPEIPTTMRAWQVTEPGPIDPGKSPDRSRRTSSSESSSETPAAPAPPLELVERPVPSPAPGEVLVCVLACGVCRTDLHVTEGDLPVHRAHVTPGHEIVGRVVALGEGAARFRLGERIGIPWLRRTCGVCSYCRSGRENLCPRSRYTGWDDDGGYAEYATVPEGFAYRIPERYDSSTVAPLLCAGIIGYRAFRRAEVPAGGRLGLYGFGGSAHITAQIAIDQGCEVHVFTRGADAQRFALELGAASANGAYDLPPVPLDSAIMFSPAGQMVPTALEGLAPGGTLALAGIHLSDVPPLTYQEHLFHEKRLTSVESNTRRDGEEFLTLADRLGIDPHVTTYPFDRADRALVKLSHGDVEGAGVLVVSEE